MLYLQHQSPRPPIPGARVKVIPQLVESVDNKRSAELQLIQFDSVWMPWRKEISVGHSVAPNTHGHLNFIAYENAPSFG